MTKTEKEKCLINFEKASKIINSWPKWKRDMILEQRKNRKPYSSPDPQ